MKHTRRELAKVIKAVDEEIVDVFARRLRRRRAALRGAVRDAVPGRRGRLGSPTPTTCSNTGIEIEARPSGKNVRRLSLLSGGERSLTALAFLFAVFRAGRRPST